MDSYVSDLTAFAQLRAKTFTCAPVALPVVEPSSISIPDPQAPTEISAVINNKTTLFPPEDEHTFGQPHRYMISMELVQRQFLVRELRKCGIELAERTSLGGVELIVDPVSAIIVSSLFTLPAYGSQLVHRIAESSWRFQNILVLLESYPETLSIRPPKSKTDIPELSAYTPPIVKAIKKLRRDVTIAEACGEKSSCCSVRYSFANHPSEAGRIARYFGDLAEEQDQTGGIVWQPRDWLDDEEPAVCCSFSFDLP
jgi:hypothetical protein